MIDLNKTKTLPNRLWLDAISLCANNTESRRLWVFYYTGRRNKHGDPILRSEPLYVSAPFDIEGDTYVVCANNELGDFDFNEPKFSTLSFGVWFGINLCRLGDFPSVYCTHGLYPSKRQALKALHEYEHILIDCDFDEAAADKIFVKLRGG